MFVQAEKVKRAFFRNGKDSNRFYAVNETDFAPQDGKVTVITGKSGSGKSTLINMLGGLLTPTEGKVFLDGKDLYALGDEERSKIRNEKIGVIPQGQTGLQSLTVLENVLVPAALYGKKGMVERALDLLKRLNADELKDAYPNELSGGEIRRMAIARALLNEPKLILADEPTGDLDEENTAVVLELLKEQARSGATVVIVTHDKETFAFADEIFVMQKGVLTKETAE